LNNALDACETANVPPVIEVTVEEDTFTVADNGPGRDVSAGHKGKAAALRQPGTALDPPVVRSSGAQDGER